MKEVMGTLGRDTLAKACTSFRSRIDAVYAPDCSFIEYVDCQYVYLLIFFYFNKIGCIIPFKRKKKKIPDLSLPPCIYSLTANGINTSIVFLKCPQAVSKKKIHS
jgi:hypothetical protein